MLAGKPALFRVAETLAGYALAVVCQRQMGAANFDDEGFGQMALTDKACFPMEYTGVDIYLGPPALFALPLGSRFYQSSNSSHASNSLLGKTLVQIISV